MTRSPLDPNPNPSASRSPSPRATATATAMALAVLLAACQPAPGESATEAGVAPATAASSPDRARLAGRVAYPSEELPAMRVCAVAPQDPGTGYCTDTAVNQPHYAIDLPPGAWWLLAWPRDTGTAGDPGILSAASDCLGSGGIGCDDHALREVVVSGGEVREGLDINDWYYDPQATPPPMEPRGERLD